MAHEHVRIAVADAAQPGVERVPARRISASEWQLLRSPLYAMEVASGDVLRVTDEDTGAFEIVIRGGNVCVQFYLAEADIDDPEATQRVAVALTRDIESLGGSMDAYTPGLIVFTIPATAGFPAIEKVWLFPRICGRVIADRRGCGGFVPQEGDRDLFAVTSGTMLATA